MKAELLRVAELPYQPDLNDGVQITAAPLWKLFRLPAWRKVLEETWKKLEKGEYDWAHLSDAIWPERVKEKHPRSLPFTRPQHNSRSPPAARRTGLCCRRANGSCWRSPHDAGGRFAVPNGYATRWCAV